jgi:hypothetical protein
VATDRRWSTQTPRTAVCLGPGGLLLISGLGLCWTRREPGGADDGEDRTWKLENFFRPGGRAGPTAHTAYAAELATVGPGLGVVGAAQDTAFEVAAPVLVGDVVTPGGYCWRITAQA